MTHAQEEMATDDISEPDVRYVLRSGRVTRSELHPDGLRYRVQGRNVDGIKMTFIVLFSTQPKRLEIRTGWVNQ